MKSFIIAARNTFSKRNTTSFNGQQQVEVESADDLLTDQQINAILGYCETSQVGGKLQTVTVPARTFMTCAS